MRVRSTTATATVPFAVLVLGGVLATSCSFGARDMEADTAQVELERAADALSATVLRPAAERAFAREGHPVPGGLTCGSRPRQEPSAPPSDSGTPGANRTAGTEGFEAPASPEPRGGRLEVHCSGETEDGAQAVFVGRLLRTAMAEREAGDDSLPGSFTGSIDGAEVFAMDCFQCSPAAKEAGEQVPGGQDAGKEKAENVEEADE
ncbi:hypothetical protein ACFWTE_04105 [Nocardiopsis sp. NPDC058631]|uniref:hypothetical protein n=1 Tax=Nocardiopsis sp. NPDC058631 TaxID=3346566 RepID=UPI0036602EF7